MNTAVISFRAHKNLKSWLDYAGKGFDSEGELLRLIITRAAVEQVNDTGIAGRVKGLLRRERAANVGDTGVFAVRLPAQVADLARECAARRGKTTSEWCAGVLMEWWQRFHEGCVELDGKVDLAKFATEYRALVEDLFTVYAQKSNKQAIAG